MVLTVTETSDDKLGHDCGFSVAFTLEASFQRQRPTLVAVTVPIPASYSPAFALGTACPGMGSALLPEEPGDG